MGGQPLKAKHPTSNIWEALKSLQAYNSPQKNRVIHALWKILRGYFDTTVGWPKFCRSAPWSWAWKAGTYVGRLGGCRADNKKQIRDGLLGQGFLYFWWNLWGKKLLFSLPLFVFGEKAEVQQPSHGWLPFPWDRRRCGVQWSSIIWQVMKYSTSSSILTAKEWTQWRFFSSAMALALKKLPAYVGAAWPLWSLSCLELG